MRRFDLLGAIKVTNGGKSLVLKREKRLCSPAEAARAWTSSARMSTSSAWNANQLIFIKRNFIVCCGEEIVEGKLVTISLYPRLRYGIRLD